MKRAINIQSHDAGFLGTEGARSSGLNADILGRFFSKGITVADNGCWEWQGQSRNKKGYCQISIEGKTALVHRLAYAIYKGPIPEGLTVDHLCYVRHCVNPNHLEAVTAAENTRRAYLRNPQCRSSGKRRPRKDNSGLRLTGNHYRLTRTHCKNGHEFNQDNTYFRADGHGRDCRICIAARSRKYQHEKYQQKLRRLK